MQAIRIKNYLLMRTHDGTYWLIPSTTGSAEGSPFFVPFMAKSQYGFLNIRKGDVVFDVGAFPGDFTLWASTCVGDSGRVVSIEPHPQNFLILRMNVKLNDLRNVLLINKAIASYKGKAWITGYGISSRLALTGIEVQATTLEDIFEELDLRRVDIIKMDIEGLEMEVLKNSSVIRNVREIAVEAHSEELFQQVANCMRNLGFTVYVLDNRLLLKNVLRAVVPHMPDFVLSELRARFFAPRLSLRNLFGFNPTLLQR